MSRRWTEDEFAAPRVQPWHRPGHDPTCYYHNFDESSDFICNQCDNDIRAAVQLYYRRRFRRPVPRRAWIEAENYLLDLAVRHQRMMREKRARTRRKWAGGKRIRRKY